MQKMVRKHLILFYDRILTFFLFVTLTIEKSISHAHRWLLRRSIICRYTPVSTAINRTFKNIQREFPQRHITSQFFLEKKCNNRRNQNNRSQQQQRKTQSAHQHFDRDKHSCISYGTRANDGEKNRNIYRFKCKQKQ